MADPESEKGKGTTGNDVPDPVAAASAATSDPARAQSPSPSSTENGGRITEEIRTGKVGKEEDDVGEDGVAKSNSPELARMKSYATATSVTSNPSRVQQIIQKPWYKQPNPLRWGKIPAVPEEKEVCREHNAGFFSALLFHWMGPLMRVSFVPFHD
jgi:hypothetical protein